MRRGGADGRAGGAGRIGGLIAMHASFIAMQISKIVKL
jgi:hypothetical protein